MKRVASVGPLKIWKTRREISADVRIFLAVNSDAVSRKSWRSPPTIYSKSHADDDDANGYFSFSNVPISLGL